MNVTVFGATGGVGSQVVGQLRSRGHPVTAYVRNPGKVPGTWARMSPSSSESSATPQRSTAPCRARTPS